MGTAMVMLFLGMGMETRPQTHPQMHSGPPAGAGQGLAGAKGVPPEMEVERTMVVSLGAWCRLTPHWVRCTTTCLPGGEVLPVETRAASA